MSSKLFQILHKYEYYNDSYYYCTDDRVPLNNKIYKDKSEAEALIAQYEKELAVRLIKYPKNWLKHMAPYPRPIEVFRALYGLPEVDDFYEQFVEATKDCIDPTPEQVRAVVDLYEDAMYEVIELEVV